MSETFEFERQTRHNRDAPVLRTYRVVGIPSILLDREPQVYVLHKNGVWQRLAEGGRTRVDVTATAKALLRARVI